MSDLDYPVAAPEGVAPVIFRSQIIQRMALEYFNYMRGSPEDFTMAEAFDAAMATWETDWPGDPAPRTRSCATARPTRPQPAWTNARYCRT